MQHCIFKYRSLVLSWSLLVIVSTWKYIQYQYNFLYKLLTYASGSSHLQTFRPTAASPICDDALSAHKEKPTAFSYEHQMILVKSWLVEDKWRTPIGPCRSAKKRNEVAAPRRWVITGREDESRLTFIGELSLVLFKRNPQWPFESSLSPRPCLDTLVYSWV